MSHLPYAAKQSYHEQVWLLVRQIPIGQVASYGQIAQLLTCPQGVTPEEYRVSGSRWVGGALAACPDDVPWQRVLNSQGKISNRPDAGRQRALLIAEGVVFIKDRLSLHEYQWPGPNGVAEPRQGSLF